MKILLVTFADMLQPLFKYCLKPELKYCAIVVDNIEHTKKFITDLNLPENIIYPYYDDEECIENLQYDLILCVTNTTAINLLPQQVRKYCSPKNKFLQLTLSDDANHLFLVKRTLNYFKLHANNFEMFATGMSYFSHGLDTSRFEKNLFNFAKASQDLYYDYQVAKFAVSHGKNLRYALIGLAPYSFHYDLSKTTDQGWRVVYYSLALNDTHNFWMSSDEIKKLFTQNFISYELPIENFDLNDTNSDKIEMQEMNLGARLRTRDRAEIWSNKNYPETFAENIKIFDDYLTLCEENNIRPIILITPVTEGYKKFFSKEKITEFHEIISAAIEKHSTAIFVDGWKIEQFADIDFFDSDHLNRLGAAKFSVILNNAIEQMN